MREEFEQSSKERRGLIDQTDALSQPPDELSFIPVGNDYCEALIKGAVTIESNWEKCHIDQAEAKRLATNWIRVASGKVLVTDNRSRSEAGELLKDIHQAANRLRQIIKVGASLHHGHP
jgi:hypothetical protein